MVWSDVGQVLTCTPLVRDISGRDHGCVDDRTESKARFVHPIQVQVDLGEFELVHRFHWIQLGRPRQVMQGGFQGGSTKGVSTQKAARNESLEPAQAAHFSMPLADHVVPDRALWTQLSGAGGSRKDLFGEFNPRARPHRERVPAQGYGQPLVTLHPVWTDCRSPTSKVHRGSKQLRSRGFIVGQHADRHTLSGGEPQRLVVERVSPHGPSDGCERGVGIKRVVKPSALCNQPICDGRWGAGFDGNGNVLSTRGRWTPKQCSATQHTRYQEPDGGAAHDF